ncbi:MAG: SdiA-regulated domain-containing protein [Cyclobacteriaceae bacterium]|nr:SdiA-regulated domain-containing protein [Cyclobacteriaceae bacterium]
MKLFSSCFFGVIFLWSMWCCRPYEHPRLAQEQAALDKFTQQTGYDLSSPNEKYLLPDVLSEISGLSFHKKNVLACVQDELGTVFLYNLKSKEIIQRMKFARNGDFEGLAVVNKWTYIIKSNGDLYRHFMVGDSTQKIETPLSRENDVEGLAYDSQHERLLIACKESANLKGDKKNKKGKAVYSYSLSGDFDRDPLILLDKQHLESWNDRQLKPLELTKKITGFKPSGIAVHPKSQDIYIVAHEGRVLIVSSPNGEVLHLVPLAPRTFKQPEGICFAPNGDLYIANEARDGVANILEFKHRP